MQTTISFSETELSYELVDKIRSLVNGNRVKITIQIERETENGNAYDFLTRLQDSQIYLPTETRSNGDEATEH